jgi:hypothetical protein
MGMTDGTSAGALFIDVQNTGFRPVAADAIQFRLPDGRALVFPRIDSTHPLPHELKEGQNLKAWVFGRHLDATLASHGLTKIDLVAECRDSLGNVHQSTPLNVDVDALRTLDE